MAKNKHFPDWVQARYAREKISDIKYTDEEDLLLRNTISSMRSGDLSYLSTLLKSSIGGLHPYIAHQLTAMIDKEGGYTDYIIETKIHDKLSRAAQSSSAKYKELKEDERITQYIHTERSKTNLLKVALIDSAKNLGMSVSTLRRIRARHLKYEKALKRQLAWSEKLLNKYPDRKKMLEKIKSGEISETPPKDFKV